MAETVQCKNCREHVGGCRGLRQFLITFGLPHVLLRCLPCHVFAHQVVLGGLLDISDAPLGLQMTGEPLLFMGLGIPVYFGIAVLIDVLLSYPSIRAAVRVLVSSRSCSVRLEPCVVFLLCAHGCVTLSSCRHAIVVRAGRLLDRSSATQPSRTRLSRKTKMSLRSAVALIHPVQSPTTPSVCRTSARCTETRRYAFTCCACVCVCVGSCGCVNSDGLVCYQRLTVPTGCVVVAVGIRLSGGCQGPELRYPSR